MSMDYKNNDVAPAYSIAALHTDLISEEDLEGVRVAKSANKVTIFWRAKHYLRRGSDDDPFVEVRLSLYDDGKIEEFLGFDNEDLEAVVQERATVGIAGSPEEQVTYASNSSAIRNGLALRYTLSLSGKR